MNAEVRTAPAPLDFEWKRWIAENLLRNCTEESMLEVTSAAGLDPAICRAEIAYVKDSPIFLAARQNRQGGQKYASVLENLELVRRLSPRNARIDKIAMPSADDFLEHYVAGCKPVVLTDLARDWPAMGKWTPQHLKDRYGEAVIEVQTERSKDQRFEENKLQHRANVRLADFVDRVVAAGPTNDFYLTANNEILRREEFAGLLDDIGTLPAICDRAQLAKRSSLWFGPAGTITPLHHDTVMLFHTQVVGRKRWRFISPMELARVYNTNAVFSEVDLDTPDFARHPKLAEARVMEVVVEPGETVFLPLGWWHQVTSLDLCISFSFSNLACPNVYEFAKPD